MKKIFGKMLCIFVILTCISGCINLSAYNSGDEIDSEGKYKIAYSETMPVLDGELEGIWNDSYELSVEQFTGLVDNAENISGKLRLMWNNTYMFLFCEIIDKNVCSSESVDENNDCVRFECGRNLVKIQQHKAENSEYDVLIYSEYKEKAFGPTINNNLRDYVIAEYKKTDVGYNIEAVIQMPSNVLLGEEIDIGATIYSIETENGSVCATAEIEKDNYTKAVLVDEDGKTNPKYNVIPFLTIDLKNEYSDEDLLRLARLYNPYGIVLLNCDGFDTSIFKEVNPYYTEKKNEDSSVSFVYLYHKLEMTQLGKLGQDVDCSYAVFTTQNDDTSFYLVGTALDEQYASKRKAQIVSIIGDLYTINRYEFPVIICAQINCLRNSFTYDALESNYLRNCELLSSDYVQKDEDLTLFNFVSYKKIDSIYYCRYDQKAVAISVNLSDAISVDKVKRKSIVYVAEAVGTLVLAAGISLILFKKSKKAKK